MCVMECDNAPLLGSAVLAGVGAGWFNGEDGVGEGDGEDSVGEGGRKGGIRGGREVKNDKNMKINHINNSVQINLKHHQISEVLVTKKLLEFCSFLSKSG